MTTTGRWWPSRHWKVRSYNITLSIEPGDLRYSSTEWLNGCMLCGLPFSAVCIKWLSRKLYCIHTCVTRCTCETCSSTMLLSLLILVTFDTCMSTEWLNGCMPCYVNYLSVLSVYKAVSFTVYIHVRYCVHSLFAWASHSEKDWLKSETLRRKSAWIGIVV